MKKMTLPAIVLLVLLQVFCRCTGDPYGEAPKAADPLPETGTAQMVRLLQDSYSKIDIMRSIYASNSMRAEQYRAKMQSSANLGEQLTNNLYYAYELLNSGKNEQAVGEFEKLLPVAQSASVGAEFIYQVKRLLALSYVRISETSNCIERSNVQSSLMPIQDRGVYAIPEASRTAVGIYEEMLNEKPDDYESMWMLNFLYMTLGEYPAKVPEKWRIPESAFKSDYEIPAFKNIADKIGVGTLGLSGGTCVDDFNNDGLLDIIASSWGTGDQIRFYVNQGTGTFADKTNEAGLAGLTGGLNTNHADYNNDGFVDVLVLRGAWYGEDGNIPNSLLKNNGDGTFTDVTVEAGVLSYAPTQNAAWADFNNDGWLDLFIGNETAKDGSVNLCEFYFNNQDGTFTNRVNETGLGQFAYFIKGCATGDVNNDGWPDLYISTLNTQNWLLLNNGATPTGAVTFKDITGIAKVHEPLIGFPCWMFDFNNDGWEDIFAAGFGVEPLKVPAHLAALNFRGQYAGGNPRLYLNNGGNSFKDISVQAGLDEALFVMGANYGDIDNDGWFDIYLGTGAPGLTAIVPNKMFRNNRGKTLQDVTTAGGFGHVQKGHAIGFGDFDNDGDQDIFSVMGGACEGDVFGNAFFLNSMGSEKSWITLKLVGTKANRSAIGSRVKVTTLDKRGRERSVFATVSTGSSFGGNSLQLELGLGDAVKIKSVEVKWYGPGHTLSVYENVRMKSFVKITEGVVEVEYYEPKRFDFPE
jgi:VCBS repeat protein/ASPIC/UnbV protein